MLHVLKKTNIIFLFLIAAQCLTASNLDSLNSLLRQEQKQSNYKREIELSIEISQENLKLNNHEVALATLNEALLKAKKIQNWKGYLKVSIDKSKVYLSLNQFPKAIETLTKLIEDLKPLEDENLATAYSELAETYRRIGNNELAYDLHLSGLHIYEEQKDSVNIARSLYNIGSIFFYQDNYEMALEYYNKTLDLCTAAKLEKHIFSCLSAIGGAYNRIHQTEKSLEYNLRAYQLGKQLGVTSGLAYAAMNLGANYAAVNDTEKALVYYEEALALNRESNDAWGECGTLRIIGEVLIDKGEFDKSYEYLMKALEIGERMGFRPRLIEIDRTLAMYYEKTGNYKLTAEYLERYALLKDSVANEASLQKMSDSKTRFEILQKEKELALKDAEFILQQRTFLLLGIGILSVILWLLFKQNRLKARSNLILAEKNKQIKKQNQELATAYSIQKETNEKIKEQYKQLEQSNVELKSFAFIASHDLKEPLRSIGSYANLLQRRYKDKLDEDANEFLDYITSSTKRLYTLLNDVLDYSKLDFNKKEIDLTDANEAMKIANENLKLKIADKKAKITIGQLPKITADKIHLVQLFQNLIDNSLKYSEEKTPVVEIESKENSSGFYEFSIKDNGIGIEPNLQLKIFDMFKRLHNREKFEGNGIGLAICKKIVHEYGGDIWVKSASGEGSTFYFTLPVPKQ